MCVQNINRFPTWVRTAERRPFYYKKVPPDTVRYRLEESVLKTWTVILSLPKKTPDHQSFHNSSGAADSKPRIWSISPSQEIRSLSIYFYSTVMCSRWSLQSSQRTWRLEHKRQKKWAGTHKARFGNTHVTCHVGVSSCGQCHRNSFTALIIFLCYR